MNRSPIIAVTRRLPAPVMDGLATRGTVLDNADDHPLTPAELATALAEADVVIPTVTDPIGADLLEAPGVRARLLANFGVGTDHVDLAAARRAGIAVTNTPGVLTDCTADLTMGLILMTLRRLGEGERELRRGDWTGWRPTHLLGQRVSGRTLGIIGLGRIGRAVAARAHHGFGMRIVAQSRSAEPGLQGFIRVCATVEEVLAEADVVSLHCPATPDTRHLINAERLRLMAPHAVLINTTRGSVVDESALAEALARRTLAGAGLDVYQEEPAVHPGLLALENVVLLPHLGSATLETRVAMGRRVLDNLDAFLARSPDGLPDRVA